MVRHSNPIHVPHVWGTTVAQAEIDIIPYTRLLPNHTYTWPLPIQDGHRFKMAANPTWLCQSKMPTAICRAHQKAAALNDSLAGTESPQRKSRKDPNACAWAIGYFLQPSYWPLPRSSGRAEPSRAEPSRAEPSRAGPGRNIFCPITLI